MRYRVKWSNTTEGIGTPPIEFDEVFELSDLGELLPILEERNDGRPVLVFSTEELDFDWNDAPDLATIQSWVNDDGGAEATDGCWVEPDGICPHGHRSWLIELNLI